MIICEKPLKIEVVGRNVFVDDEAKDFEVRMLSQMNDVFRKKIEYKKDFPVYFMFRNIINKNEIRFDITIIPPRIYGKEYAKTYGHYHEIAEENLTYPEIYQIYDGEAIFVLQKKERDGMVDVILINGKKGDVLFIPPNYGHVSINSNIEKNLILGNIIYSKSLSFYEEFKENRGAAYYITEDGIEQNTSYLVKNLRRMKADEINKLYKIEIKDLISDLIYNSEKLEFLKRPSLLGRNVF